MLTGNSLTSTALFLLWPVIGSWPPVASALDLRSWRARFDSADATLGVWSPRPALTGAEREVAEDLFHSLEVTDRTLKVAVIGPPHRDSLVFDANATLDEDGALKVTNGFSKDVWDYLQAYTGLRAVSVVAARTWGSATNLNATMTGMLASSEVDATMGVIAHCCDRFDVHNFTEALYTRSFSIIFRQPERAKDIFGGLFSEALWMSIGIVLLVLASGMLVINFFFLSKFEDKSGGDEWFDKRNILSWIFCVMSQQGHNPVPSYFSGRLLFLVGFCFGLLCFGGFQANIVSTLTSVTSIGSFDELVDYEAMKIHTSHFTPFRTEISESRANRVQNMWLKSKKDMEEEKVLECKEFYKTCDQKVMDKMSLEGDSTVAFASPEQYMHDPDNFVVNKNKALSCELTRFRMPIGEQAVLYGVRPGLPSRRLINLGILRMKEAGLIGHLRHKWAPHPPACADFQTVSFKPVSMRYVYGAYLALCVGYAAAVALAAAELAASRWFSDSQHPRKLEKVTKKEDVVELDSLDAESTLKSMS